MKGNFQIIILVVFIAFGVLGVLVFSGAIPLGSGGGQNAGVGTVVLWGTAPSARVANIIQDFNTANQNFTVNYVEKSADSFDRDLLEALASGNGPDMFFLPADLAFKYGNKIYTIPYESYPQSNFKNIYSGAGEVFMTSRGIVALPLAVDPLVMYYNRSMLDANAVVNPPFYWDEFTALTPVLTKKDDANRIMKSAFALGQYANVNHAKEILSTLFMQGGNPIITEKDGFFTAVLNEFTGQYNLATILKFYTDFADPLGSVYSWNKSFPNSADAFSAENLVFYFGYASELETLVNKNPNQNFFVAGMPQIRGASFKLTGAKVTGVAVSAFSKNANTALIAAQLMAQGDFAGKFAQALGMAPARKDLLVQMPQDSFSPTFYTSALIGRGWLDPAPADTDNIFRQMVEGVLSNNFTPGSAIRDANSKLGLLLIPKR